MRGTASKTPIIDTIATTQTIRHIRYEVGQLCVSGKFRTKLGSIGAGFLVESVVPERATSNAPVTLGDTNDATHNHN